MFTKESPLYFPVASRPVMVDDKEAEGYRMIVRTDTGANLGVVGDRYKVVTNQELFGRIEDELTNALTPKEIEGVQIFDKLSHNGAFSLRDYRFPNVMVPPIDDGKKPIAFRVIAINGYAKSALKLYSGAIDFFCTNGMITGRYETTYKKHTQRLDVGNVAGKVRDGVDRFGKFMKRARDWQTIPLADGQAEDTLKALPTMAERLASRLFAHYTLHEKPQRGPNVWGLYSALTYYASHEEDERFKLRDTGTDHGAFTMLQRGEKVSQWINSEPWLNLTRNVIDLKAEDVTIAPSTPTPALVDDSIPAFLRRAN